MPAYNTQALGNSLGWGIVNDAPIAFVWEIGHTSIYRTSSGAVLQARAIPPAGPTMTRPGPALTPIQIQSVTFADGSKAKHWATVSDQGGKAEVAADPCAAYGGPFCIYPWYSQSPAGFPATASTSRTATKNFGKANQFHPDPPVRRAERAEQHVLRHRSSTRRRSGDRRPEPCPGRAPYGPGRWEWNRMYPNPARVSMNAWANTSGHVRRQRTKTAPKNSPRRQVTDEATPPLIEVIGGAKHRAGQHGHGRWPIPTAPADESGSRSR